MKNIVRCVVPAMLFTIAAFANSEVNVPSGVISVRTFTTISSKTAKVNMRWEGSVAKDVTLDDEVVLRRGAPVEGIVESVVTKGQGPAARLSLRLLSVDAKPARTASYQVQGEVKERKASRTMTGWGITGALVGAVLSGGKGAAAGAAAGAGIGAMRAGRKATSEAIVPAESILTFDLERY